MFVGLNDEEAATIKKADDSVKLDKDYYLPYGSSMIFYEQKGVNEWWMMDELSYISARICNVFVNQSVFCINICLDHSGLQGKNAQAW